MSSQDPNLSLNLFKSRRGSFGQEDDHNDGSAERSIDQKEPLRRKNSVGN